MRIHFLRIKRLYRKKLDNTKELNFKTIQGEFEKYWLIIPIILYAIGFFIHNIYLNQFSTFDFEIIQTKYIYIGVLFTFYLTLLVVLLSLKTNLDDENRIPEILRITTWLVRIPLIIFIINSFLNPTGQVSYNVIRLFFEDFISSLVFIFSAITLFFYFMWFIFLNNYNFISRRKVDLIIRYYFLISLTPIFYTSYIFYNNDKYFKIIVDFLSSPILVFSIAWGVISNFLRLKVDKKNKTLMGFVTALFIGFILFFSMIYYSNQIYPYIPSNYGGAKPIQSIIYTETDTITCKLINENSEWFLIYIQEQKHYERIRVASVKHILISGKPTYAPAIPKTIYPKSTIENSNK